MPEYIKNDLKTFIYAKEDFTVGEFEDTYLNSERNIVLKDDVGKGSFISPTIDCNEFRQLIASWNAYTSVNSQIELQIKIKKNNQWSSWFSSGKWSISNNRGSISDQQNEFAKMDDESLMILGQELANGFRFRIILKRDNIESDSPEVKLIAIALKLSNDSKRTIEYKFENEWLKELDVPERAQLCIPDIGNSICSPTSLAMVMEYYGYNYDTEFVASQVKDNEAGIYGNWSFNTAYLGLTGLYGYVDRFHTVDELKKMISMDMPAVVSIKTRSMEELNGSIMPYPSGHLMVVRGFKIKDGNEYVIVNDPAEHKKENVRREYKVEEFQRVWRKIAYVINPDLNKIKEFCM